MDYIVRKIIPEELPKLTELFDYNDISGMIEENTRLIENGTDDIFILLKQEKLLGELHVRYESSDPQEAAKGTRAYLYAFRIHKDHQGLGLGKFLLRTVINSLSEAGYSEFTVGVEDHNLRALHIYKSFGFDEIIAHKYEEYQGDSYEYDLYLKRVPPQRDFIFIIGTSGVGKSTLAKKLSEHYRSALIEQNQAPEFISFDGCEEISGLYEEYLCFQWLVSSLMFYHNAGIKNIVADDFDDLRTRDIPEIFKGYNYITLKLICSDYQQNYEQMKNRGNGLVDFELLEKSSAKINSRSPLINEFVIDVSGKSPDEVFSEAVRLIAHAETAVDYDYTKPPAELFYSWVFANGLR